MKTDSGAHVLAVDLGTGGPKAALVSTSGKIAGHEQEQMVVQLLPGGGAEQDPEAWWRAIVRAVRRLLARELVPRERIAAVAVTSQWMGTVAVDGAGHALGNAVIWLDSRGAPHVKTLVGGGLEVPGTGYSARKLYRWLRLTGGVPSLSGKDPVGHVQFLRHERKDIYAAARLFLEPMDYLNLRLTGRAVATLASVTGYWCTDNRNLRNLQYDEALVARSGLPREKLPELVPTASVVGPLSAHAAEELGLDSHVPVVTAMADTASAGIGAGAVASYDAHLYVGTSSWLSCHVPWKRTDLATNIASLPSGIPDRYWVATEQDAAGKCLTWLVDNVLYPKDALGTAEPPPDVFDRLNALARDVPPGSHGVLFLPWLNGEKTPVDDHRVRGGWVNLGLTTDRGALVRSVFEGVALNTRWMMQAAEHFVRKERPGGFEELRFVGGGARSPLWCQIFADVLGRRILQVEEPLLANVRGAALGAFVALGALRWEDIRARVPIARSYEPDPASTPLYDRQFESFVDLYRKTRHLGRRKDTFPS